MDWYFGNGVGDFLVLKDQDLFDRLPSPESWTKWGISASECSTFSTKRFNMNSNSTEEELNFNGRILGKEVDMESFTFEKDHSSVSSASGGFSQESLPQTALSYNQPDDQLDGLPGIEQLDEFFLSSLREDLPRTENLHGSFCFSPELHGGMVPHDSLLTDMILDSQSASNDAHDMGSSKDLKTHAFSPPIGWEKGEAAASQFDLCNSEQKDWEQEEARQVKLLVPSEHDRANGLADKETSVEESVLQELEAVMAQFTKKTRICFRDALYRLANSRQHMVKENQNGDFSMETPPWTVEDEKMRSGGKKTMEMETNTIDRAIANLMFNKMDQNVQDFPVSASVISNQGIASETAPLNCSSNQPWSYELPPNPIFGRGDAEVPIIGRGCAETRGNQDKHMWANALEEMMMM